MRLTKEEEQYAWPPKSRLNFYSRDTCGCLFFELTSSYRLFDLSDNITPEGPQKSRTVYFGISTKSALWSTWDDSNLQKIEWLIRYDLQFDGYRVAIKRVTTRMDLPCTEEFLWKLIIRVP